MESPWTCIPYIINTWIIRSDLIWPYMPSAQRSFEHTPKPQQPINYILICYSVLQVWIFPLGEDFLSDNPSRTDTASYPLTRWVFVWLLNLWANHLQKNYITIGNIISKNYKPAMLDSSRVFSDLVTDIGDCDNLLPKFHLVAHPRFHRNPLIPNFCAHHQVEGCRVHRLIHLHSSWPPTMPHQPFAVRSYGDGCLQRLSRALPWAPSAWHRGVLFIFSDSSCGGARQTWQPERARTGEAFPDQGGLEPKLAFASVPTSAAAAPVSSGLPRLAPARHWFCYHEVEPNISCYPLFLLCYQCYLLHLR